MPLKRAEPGLLTTFAYDAKGNLTSQSAVETTDLTGALQFAAAGPDASRLTTALTYTSSSLPSTIRETSGGDATGVGAIETGRWTLAFNALADLSSIADSAGPTARATQYDAQGRLVTEVDPYGTRSVAYTPRGFILSEAFAGSSPAVPSYTLTAVHDPRGLVTELNTGTGSVYRWTYDAGHRINSMTLNGASLMAGVRARSAMLPRIAAALTLSRDAQAQTTAPSPAPGGGIRGGGWLGLAGLIFQIGRNIVNQQGESRSQREAERCDACRDPNHMPEWISRGWKHTVPPSLDWAGVRAGTANGNASKYKPEITRSFAAHRAHEESIWRLGRVIKNDKSSVWKVARRSYVVGAAEGKDTTCTAALCSAGQIHGFPAPESDCDRPGVAYP